MSRLEIGERVTITLWGDILATGTVTGHVAVFDDGACATWRPDGGARMSDLVLRPKYEGMNWMRGEGAEVESALRAAYAIWANCV